MKKVCFLLAVFMFLAMPSSFGDAAISADLQKLLANERGGQIPVIVQMEDSWQVSSLIAQNQMRGDRKEVKKQVCDMLKSLTHDSQASVRNYLSGQRSAQAKNVHHFWIVNSISLHATANVINDLAKLPGVKAIIHDKVQVMINPVSEANSRNAAWGISYSRADKVNAEGITGKGITVAVLDTGVDLDHSVFAADQVDVEGSESFVWFEWDADDGNGHGTHCAGTIGGQNGVGVAPGVTIIAGKVLSSSGSGSLSGITKGIEFGVKNADVVSMSLGGQDDGSVNDMERAVQAGIDAGVVFAIAGGNSGPDSYTIGTPGCEPKAITVGALADADGNHTSNGDAHDIAKFSSRGPDSTHGANKPDITAPGVNIYSSWKDGGWNTISGTSMATPHIAGIIALMLEANPKLTPAEVKSILTNTCVPPVVKQKDPKNVYGAGIVDAYAAYQQALNMK